jgi:hypothetical protein
MRVHQQRNYSTNNIVSVILQDQQITIHHHYQPQLWHLHNLQYNTEKVCHLLYFHLHFNHHALLFL